MAWIIVALLSYLLVGGLTWVALSAGVGRAEGMTPLETLVFCLGCWPFFWIYVPAKWLAEAWEPKKETLSSALGRVQDALHARFAKGGTAISVLPHDPKEK